MGFPMEMYQSGAGAVWVVSHKPVAVEAGLGHMGIHRNLIHPKFGNFVLLGTVLIGREASDYDRPIDYNPCLECKLCVAACPVGAIGPDGSFNFSSCFTHNYREFIGGFPIGSSRWPMRGTRSIIGGASASPRPPSMWQSLSHGANYKSAYCMAVCPAGEDVIGPYLRDKQRHLQEVVKPLQERAEPVYVVPGSDAEAIARRKFKNKTVKPVGNGLRPRSIAGLLNFMPHVFQPNQSRGLDATFHFTFTGAETARCDDQDPESNARRSGTAWSARRTFMSRRTQDLARFSRERETPDIGIDPKKDSRERQSKAAAGLWQMLSHRRCHGIARSRYSAAFTASSSGPTLSEERSGYRKDQMAGQTRARRSRETSPTT